MILVFYHILKLVIVHIAEHYYKTYPIKYIQIKGGKMKIHITAVIDSPMTKEEHEATLTEIGMTQEEFIKSLYSEIECGICKGYCSKNEVVVVKNVQVNF
jgi:hypothetical protein